MRSAVSLPWKASSVSTAASIWRSASWTFGRRVDQRAALSRARDRRGIASMSASKLRRRCSDARAHRVLERAAQFVSPRRRLRLAPCWHPWAALSSTSASGPAGSARAADGRQSRRGGRQRDEFVASTAVPRRAYLNPEAAHRHRRSHRPISGNRAGLGAMIDVPREGERSMDVARRAITRIASWCGQVVAEREHALCPLACEGRSEPGRAAADDHGGVDACLPVARLDRHYR